MSLLKRKLGVIGCGNMARGILSGVLTHRVIRPRSIFVYDVLSKAAGAFRKKFHVIVEADARSVFRKSDIVLLAVKPQQLSEALRGLGSEKLRAKLVVTILAGVPRKKVSSLLPGTVRVVRAMPNLGATVGSSFTALSGSGRSDLSSVKKLFCACGKVVVVPEAKMDLITALSGSGPAYFFFLMELLAAEGVKYGLSKSTAEELAIQTALGASKLANTPGAAKPLELRRAVTSKGGTTEAAIHGMESLGIRRIFSEAIRRGLRRAKELGRRS